MPRQNPRASSWAEYVALQPRYQRSAHLERDQESSDKLSGYVVTPLVRLLASRIAHGLTAPRGKRAWSLTGPYGTGKSSFALFLADLLSETDGRRSVARRLLRKADAETYELLCGRGGPCHGHGGLVPVLVTGERAPLDQLLLQGLAEAARRHWSGPGTKPAAISRAEELATDAASGKAVGSKKIVALFQEIAAKAATSNKRGTGLLIVLDEAGKALEYAARHPDRGDVHLLQELAEAADRSEQFPIVFCAVLHQSFERYAGRLPAADRNEWAKVQGRFEDVAFQEDADQILRLIGCAVGLSAPDEAIRTSGGRKTLDRVAKVVCAQTGWHAKRLRVLLEAALPLHPVTALALAPLFRAKLAQNERSLFAFLGSTEAAGFAEFLAAPRTGRVWPLYTVDRLYDYVDSAFGGRVYSGEGRLWALIESTLSRLPAEATALDARVVKAVGLLSAVGEKVGLMPSPKLLEMALVGTDGCTADDLKQSLKGLQKSSLLVFRKYRNAYQLWDGSDLDLDRLVSRGLAAIDSELDLPERLTRLVPQRPVVARRHLFVTGTLRYFDVLYGDETALDNGLDAGGDGDGTVWLLLPSSKGAEEVVRQRLAQQLTWVSSRKPALAAVLPNAERVRSLARELTALEWVRAHTAELRDDPVARRELDGRIADAQRLLAEELSRTVSGRGEGATWFEAGEPLTVRGGRGLAEFVSTVCDRVYSQTPHLHNELLNRTHLSSAAAAARRELMQAMLDHGAEPRLGFEGFPPQLSMYRSMLEKGQLHAEGDGGEWLFQRPQSRKAGTYLRAWKAIENALGSQDGARVPMTDLYARLKRPPFGMKDGPIPVLLLAILISGSDELAIYEEGVFIPKIGAPEVERLLRAPERFAVQRFAVTGPRLEVLTRLSAAFVRGRSDSTSALPVVRFLVRFANQLPEFTRNSSALSDEARAIREALLRAREPGKMLFEALPEACGVRPITVGKDSERDVDDFLKRLRQGLTELQDAFPRLLDSIEGLLIRTFGLPHEPAAARTELASRCSAVRDAAAEPKLKGFLMRVADEALGRDEWLVSIATLLGGKPPEYWRDPDRDIAAMSLAKIRQQFAALESLSVAGRAEPGQLALLRLSVMEAGGAETERVIPLRQNDSFENLPELRVRLAEVVKTAITHLPVDVVLAELALSARALMDDPVSSDAEASEHFS